VSPRGVAIPDIRAQLFQAADRLLARDGPSGLSSRAITAEAGVAKGILHSHFEHLDDFLAEFIADRLRSISDAAAELPSRAGTGTVLGNLTDAVESVFGSNALALINLVTARPALASRMRHVESRGKPQLRDIEGTFVAYLDAEKKLGRISPDADTETLAFALLGSIHHLFLVNRAGVPNLRNRVHRIVAAVVGGITT